MYTLIWLLGLEEPHVSTSRVLWRVSVLFRVVVICNESHDVDVVIKHQHACMPLHWAAVCAGCTEAAR